MYFEGCDYSDNPYTSDDSIDQEDSDFDFYDEEGEYGSSTYYDDFMSSLKELYTSSELCDVTLKAEEYQVRAHKLVLATVGYFRSMFTQPWKEKADDTVKMEGLTGFGLKALVDFVYTGKMKKQVDHIRDVLEAARHCQFDHLTKVCERYLLKSYKADEQTYQEIISVAKEYSLNTEIVQKCEHFFKINFIVGRENYVETITAAKACQSEVMLKSVIDYTRCNPLPIEVVTAALDLFDEADVKNLLLGRNGLDVTRHAVEFLVRWIEHNEEERLPFLSGLFKSVNLMVFIGETLQEISALKYINSNEECQTLIRQVRKEAERGTYLLSLLPHEYVVLRDINDPKVMHVGLKIPEVDMKGEPKGTNFRLTNDFAATVYEDVLYVCGSHWSVAEVDIIPGFSSPWSLGQTSLHCFKFDLLHHQWTQLASLENARCHHSLTGLDGSIYSIGGVKPQPPGYTTLEKTGIPNVDVYSPSNDAWSVGEPFPRGVYDHAATVSDGKIYVSGGTGTFFPVGASHPLFLIMLKKPHYNNFECFDPALKKWERRATLLRPAAGHQLVAAGPALYQLGGNLDNEIYRYCSTSDQWSKLILQLPPPPKDFRLRRTVLGAATPVLAYNDCIYIVVGQSQVDISDNQWTEVDQSIFRYNTKTEEVDILQTQTLKINHDFSSGSKWSFNVPIHPGCFFVNVSKRTIEQFYEQITLERSQTTDGTISSSKIRWLKPCGLLS